MSCLRRRAFRGLKVLGILLVLRWLCASVILPALRRHYEHHPAPKATPTADGIPGDPRNVGPIGGEADVGGSRLAVGWSPADPITLKSSFGIAESVVFRRPDPDAPVSGLDLFGRRQDLLSSRHPDPPSKRSTDWPPRFGLT